jgi:hypothetical protein
VAALSAVATLGVAVFAFRSWREQLRGKSKYDTAAEIAEAVRLLRYHFYDARSPLYEAWEFPVDYHKSMTHTDAEEADAFQHIFNTRLKQLWPQYLKVATLRAKAGAVLGEEFATSIEKLARKVRWLEFFMKQKVAQLRAGPAIVAQWSDQDYVVRVDQSVVVDPDNHGDSYSVEFETMFAELDGLLRPFM